MRLGIDIGGTKIEGALVSNTGKILRKERLPTETRKGKAAIINNILSIISVLDNKKVKSIGVGIPGVVDSKGILSSAPNLKPLIGTNIGELIASATGKKVFVDNDANCFALAEHLHGAGHGYKNVVGVIIGTGIGSGIIINNQLYKGDNLAAGEVGGMIIDTSKNSSFENLCSGPGIVKRYKKLGGKITNPNPKTIFASKEKVAKKTMTDTYKYLGVGFANIINILNPGIIVLGGGVSNLPFYKQVNLETKKHTKRKTFVVKNKLGDSSGVVGAAFLRG